ncbi:glucose-inhibited division protein B [Halomonas sp. ATCH28]|uniref:Glucose-inhibited division protein B n=2 Tax=Halomonas gemina TaxID=2945105 RepID=A0ABT0T753_9GAMM|nr:glucose-inhibited division protein B [Halomonas gemina]
MGALRRSAACLAVTLIAGLLLTGCGGEAPASEVPLPVLANNPAVHDDSRVATRGVVRHFEDPLHYWIEDEDLNRVEIFPHERVALHLGEAVRVEGHFRYSPREGRRLTLESIERLEGG